MIVAITGGTGFIGRKLALRHLALGDEVRVLSRRPPGSAELPDPVKWCSGDLTGPGDLRSFVENADVLYHCAGEIGDETRMQAVHVEGTQRLIREAAGRIGRWVQLSSVGAYGRQREGIVTEQTELNPRGAYEITKAASDALVSAAAQGGAFEHAVLRPSNVYGAGMSNQSLYGLIEMIRRGWFFFIGEPGASANYIHVDNVVEALLLCGTKPDANGRVYNLSDHRTMEQFVAAIAASLGKRRLIPFVVSLSNHDRNKSITFNETASPSTSSGRTADLIRASLGKPMPHLRMPEWPIRLSARLLGSVPGFPLTEARVDALTGRAIYSSARIERELDYRHRVSMEEGIEELVRFRPRTTAI